MSDMMKSGLNVFVLLFVVSGCQQPAGAPDAGDHDHDHDHEGDYTKGRLAVAHADGGLVTIIDLDGRAVVGSVALPGPGTVYADATSAGGFVYATRRTSNQTHVLASGLKLQAHDDHFHVEKEGPQLTAAAISGAMPTHFTAHEGWIALFNDGDGTVDFFSEAQVASGSVTPARASTGRAHHGVAVVYNDRLVATRWVQLADGGVDALPDGATDRVRTAPDTVMSSFGGCAGLHGEATRGTEVAFGCSSGLLSMKWTGSAFTSTTLPHPAGRGERIGTVEAHPKWPVFIGNFDLTPANGLAVVDTAANSISPVDLPTRRFGFRFDLGGEYVVVLTMDGKLHRFTLNSGKNGLDPVGQALQVIPAFDTFPAAPRPVLATGWGEAYVTDPRDGSLKIVDLTGWTVAATVAVGGSPASLAVTGASPDWESRN